MYNNNNNNIFFKKGSQLGYSATRDETIFNNIISILNYRHAPKIYQHIL